MFFESWDEILRVISVGICAYIAIIFILRISGKRTLSKMNMFDYIVTVAFGSTLSSVFLNADVTLAEGITAFIVLTALQFIVTKVTQIFQPFEGLIKAQPTLLFYNGEFRQKCMTRERVSREEIFSSIRECGVSHLEDVEAVVLETTGTLSVLQKSEVRGPSDTLEYVQGFEN